MIDSLSQFNKIRSILHLLPNIKAIVIYAVDELPEEVTKLNRVYLWNDFLELGKDIST